MRLRFDDDDLRRLYEDRGFRLAWFGPDVVKAYRKKVAFIASARDERDLWGYRALRFEKLVGDRAGPHSIHLNDQWRLILSLVTEEDERVVVIIELIDYH